MNFANVYPQKLFGIVVYYKTLCISSKTILIDAVNYTKNIILFAEDINIFLLHTLNIIHIKKTEISLE